jgi:hypothetical protein
LTRRHVSCVKTGRQQNARAACLVASAALVDSRATRATDACAAAAAGDLLTSPAQRSHTRASGNARNAQDRAQRHASRRARAQLRLLRLQNRSLLRGASGTADTSAAAAARRLRADHEDTHTRQHYQERTNTAACVWFPDSQCVMRIVGVKTRGNAPGCPLHPG